MRLEAGSYIVAFDPFRVALGVSSARIPGRKCDQLGRAPYQLEISYPANDRRNRAMHPHRQVTVLVPAGLTYISSPSSLTTALLWLLLTD